MVSISLCWMGAGQWTMAWLDGVWVIQWKKHTNIYIYLYSIPIYCLGARQWQTHNYTEISHIEDIQKVRLYNPFHYLPATGTHTTNLAQSANAHGTLRADRVPPLSLNKYWPSFSRSLVPNGPTMLLLLRIISLPRWVLLPSFLRFSSLMDFTNIYYRSCINPKPTPRASMRGVEFHCFTPLPNRYGLVPKGPQQPVSTVISE